MENIPIDSTPSFTFVKTKPNYPGAIHLVKLGQELGNYILFFF